MLFDAASPPAKNARSRAWFPGRQAMLIDTLQMGRRRHGPWHVFVKIDGYAGQLA
jgi:hypothetical protein